jgi:hypothetical protein
MSQTLEERTQTLQQKNTLEPKQGEVGVFAEKRKNGERQRGKSLLNPALKMNYVVTLIFLLIGVVQV